MVAGEENITGADEKEDSTWMLYLTNGKIKKPSNKPLIWKRHQSSPEAKIANPKPGQALPNTIQIQKKRVIRHRATQSLVACDVMCSKCGQMISSDLASMMPY